jgi:hypothetical protein
MVRFSMKPFLRRVAVILMMAAVAAFTLQGTLIATSEAATGEAGRFHHAHGHPQSDHAAAAGESHMLTHVHADGTVHRHAIDDDDGGLDEHIKEHGCPCCWNMAVAFGVLPTLNIGNVVAIGAYKLAIGAPNSLTVADPPELTHPPRPPCIA